MSDEAREESIQKLVDYLEKVQEEEEWIDPDTMIREFTKLLRLTKQSPNNNKRFEYFKNTVLELMVKCGGYYKSLANYSSKEAIKMFKVVIVIEDSIPIAHYRLGHLYYRERHYIESLFHFHKAVSYSNIVGSSIRAAYKLDELQINHANLFIAINGLTLAKEKKDIIRDYDGIYRNLTDQMIESLEFDYRKVEFVQYNLTGFKHFISADERDKLLDRDDIVILYRVDDEIFIQFGEKDSELNLSHFYFLKQLLKAKKDRPLMPNRIVTYDQSTQESYHDLNSATFRKRVQRLRDVLRSNEIPFRIENGRVDMANQGYYALSDAEYYFIEREETFMHSLL